MEGFDWKLVFGLKRAKKSLTGLCMWGNLLLGMEGVERGCLRVLHLFPLSGSNFKG
jgi:hypothetical protein